MELISLNSAAFVVVSALLFRLSPPYARGAMVLGVSLTFCALISGVAAAALAMSAVATFLIGRMLDAARPPRVRAFWLSFGVLILLAHLVAVKIAADGALSKQPLVSIVVAGFGASYYSFKLISYLLDVYWRRYAAWRNGIDFCAVITFFPQLPAGPIQRPGEFSIAGWALPDDDQIAEGFRRMLIGLMKKLLVADQLASITAPIADAQPAQAHLVWLLAYLYPIQLYADFSGLADIAIGCASLFGIRSPENFDHPFFVHSISAYWRKWHMTLTRWLGDYVFMPLRMATRDFGNLGLVASITVNMILIGLWHGITMGCLLFGVAHAVFLSVDALSAQWRRRFYRRRPQAAAAVRVVGPIAVYHMVALAMLIFGTTSAHEAARLVGDWALDMTMLGTSLNELFAWMGHRRFVYVMLAVVAFVMYEIAGFVRSKGGGGAWKLLAVASWMRPYRWAAYYAAIVLILIGRGASSRFIYVRF